MQSLLHSQANKQLSYPTNIKQKMQQNKPKQQFQNSLRIQQQDYALTAQIYHNKLRFSLQYFSLQDYKVYTSIFIYQELPQIFQFFFESIQQVFYYLIDKNNIHIVAEKGIVNFKMIMIKKDVKIVKDLQLKLQQQTVQQNVKNTVIIGKLNTALQNTQKQLKIKEQQNNQLKTKYKQKINKIKTEFIKIKQDKQKTQIYMTKQIQKLRQFIKNISQKTNQLNQQLYQQKPSYYFMQNIKHSGFTIQGNHSNIIISTQNSNKLALIQSKYLYTSQYIFQIQFIIIKRTNEIGIGICDKNVIAENNYVLNHKKIQQHGTYMVIQDIIISSNKNQHLLTCAQKFNRIKQGDIIKLILKPKNQIITFLKNNQQLSLLYKNIKHKNLCFCVYMYGQGDIIRIRQPKSQ